MTKRFIFLIFVSLISIETNSWSGRMWDSDKQREIQQTIWRLKYYYPPSGNWLERLQNHETKIRNTDNYRNKHRQRYKPMRVIITPER